MRKLSGSILLATAGLLLTACGGGATVDNQSATQATVAPLSKAAKPSGSEQTTASASKSPEATKEPSKSDGAPAAAPAPRDKAAQEISALPTSGPKRSASESKYLEALQKQGIKVEGIEDQMIGAANQACQKDRDNYLVGAIAGQLVEQKRTEKKAEEVADIITKSAKDGYC
ncbi:hypothetical protein QVA66_07790 [Staphylococcus chromogenes]|nr:hypothetical protein [Staphylococcus chromogenes]